jgi:hypothetical protein
LGAAGLGAGAGAGAGLGAGAGAGAGLGAACGAGAAWVFALVVALGAGVAFVVAFVVAAGAGAVLDGVGVVDDRAAAACRCREEVVRADGVPRMCWSPRGSCRSGHPGAPAPDRHTG